MGRVFILDFHVNVANDMWNLGLLHILMYPILFYLFHFHFIQHLFLTQLVPAAEKKYLNIIYRLEIQGGLMFDDPVFFYAPIF